MAQFRTVADVIADLQKMPQNLPVLVGCHYDNDNGLTNEFEVRLSDAEHCEVEFYMEVDPNPDAFGAVLIQ